MSKLKLALVMFILSYTFASCKKEVMVQLPFDVLTDSVSQIDWTSAVSGGDVKTDGGSIVAFRGVVWDTKPSPTADLLTKTSDGRGTGSFKSKIEGLVANTQYYVRSYAINSTDTIYGNEVTFKTSSWTPREIKNVWDWWNSENGIIKEGDYIEYWIGVKGTKLEHGSDKDKALFVGSDKDWGNKPSVLMNPNFKTKDCGYYTKSSTAKSSKTVFMVSKLYDFHKNNNIMFNFGMSSIGIWGNSNGSYFVYHITHPHTGAGNKFTKGSYQFIKVSYDFINGGTTYSVDNDLSFRNTIHTFNSKSGLYYSNRTLGLGYYDSKYGQTPKMSVVELLVLDGIPTDEEVITYEKYLKYKYNL